MIAPAREAFVKRAMIELSASGCTKISPFFTSRNYAELKEQLDAFSDNIISAIAVVKSAGGLLSELPEEQEELRRTGSESLAKFMLATDLSPQRCENQELRLMDVFLNEVGVASNSLRMLEKEVKEKQSIPRPQLVEAVQRLIGLEHFVLAIPKVYESIPVEQQVAQDFVFRTYDLA